MSACPGCAFDFVSERAAIRSRDLDLAPAVHSCGEVEVGITHFTPAQFAIAPQIGRVIRQEWSSFALWLSHPTFGADKKAAGAWCPAALEGGIVKAGTGPVSLLVADVDDCDEGALERSAEALADYRGAIVPTASATREKPKHRIVLVPSRALLPAEYSLAWAKLAADLEMAGIVVDRGCKNLNRLYFACVARSPEAWLGARILEGGTIPVDAMLEAARLEEDERSRARAPRVVPPPITESRSDKYVSAAIDRERGNLAAVGEGGRHDALLRAAFALARFDELSEADLLGALLDPFVAIAGEPRRREGERAIRDAVAARKGAA